MAKRPVDPETIEEAKPSLASRLAWLMLIWGASIMALAVAAMVLRAVMGLAGLRS